MSDIDNLLEKTKKELKEIRQSVETARDEAKVKAHLAKADLKDEWDKLEDEFEDYQAKMKRWEDTTFEKDEIANKARELGKELKSSYQRIKKKLTD